MEFEKPKSMIYLIFYKKMLWILRDFHRLLFVGKQLKFCKVKAKVFACQKLDLEKPQFESSEIVVRIKIWDTT